VAFRDLSGSLFVDLVNELRALDDPNMPVLFAVDGYNNWEAQSSYAYNNRRLSSKSLCVPYALNFASIKKADALNWSMKNGICIGKLEHMCTLLRQAFILQVMWMHARCHLARLHTIGVAAFNWLTDPLNSPSITQAPRRCAARRLSRSPTTSTGTRCPSASLCRTTAPRSSCPRCATSPSRTA
jgi:hypothetical protein